MAGLGPRLIEPASSVQGLEARLNARLLAVLLLAVIGMELVGTLVIAITIYRTRAVLLLLVAVIPLLAAYALSRTTHYRLGAALSIIVFSLIPYITLAVVAGALTSDLVFLSLTWLSLPVLLVGLFFSLRTTAISALLINLSIALVPVLVPNVDRARVNTALGLVFTVSALSMMLMHHRERIERSRQAALGESEARYRRLAENAQDIIYRYDFTPQRRITYVNPAVSSILGYTPAELYADPNMFLNLIHPGDRSSLLSVMTSGVSLAEPLNLRWMRRDGTVVWIEHRNVPLYDQMGNMMAVEGIARDITERQHWEEMQRRSEANLAEAQRIAHFGSWIWDLATGILQCSDEMFRLVGLRPQEVKVTQEIFLKFLHPDEVAWILDEIQRSVANDPPTGIEHRIVRSNGEIRTVYSQVKAYQDEAGAPLRLLGSTQDITERKQAEAQIERNLRQLVALERMGQTVVASLDLTVVLTRVIEEISSLLGAEGVSVLLIEDQDKLVFSASNGRGMEALLGQRMPIHAGIAGEVVRTRQAVWVNDSADQARIYRDIDKAIGYHTQSLLAVPLNLHDEIIGVMEAVHTQPKAFEVDDLHLLEASATWATVAITNARLYKDERRRVQEQAALLEVTQIALSSFEFSLPILKQIAQRVAQACHSTRCMLCSLEGQTATVRPLIVQSAIGQEDEDASPVLESITTVPLDGLPAMQTIVSERRPQLFEDADQAGLLPTEWTRLFGFKHILAVPLLSQGAAIGLMMLGYEIDQVVDDNYFNLALTLGAQIAIAFVNARLYADLQQSLQHERAARAQVVQAEKLAAIGRLSASVAHELNNPLQVIQNSLYLVRHESVLEEQAQADLDAALAESQRMADLIERMRETYRPTTVTELRLESINVLIGEVEKLISTHLRHNKVTYQFNPESQLPPVPCLRDQLKQVILNVSLNAVEAMPDGGQLTISTSTSPTADGIWVTFADTGQGISPADLPNIFDPFFTRKARGTGLGLAISYDIIQQHLGRIEVDSELGRGTTFRIWLPTKES